jgi:predicted nucleotidyltransferase
VDPIIKRFRGELSRVFHGRIERVVLFGSRAQGKARTDSDYDVAVFLSDSGSFGEEAKRLADIESDILLDTGVVINALPFLAGSWADQTAFMAELRRDGIDL